MSEVHGEGYACGHCGRKFAKRKHLNSHIARIRKNTKKKSEHIFFEHEVTLPGEEDGSMKDSSSSESSDNEEESEDEEHLLGKKRVERDVNNPENREKVKVGK